MNGRFVEGGWAFEISHMPDTPWSNVLCNGTFGSVWTERGGAFAWCGNSVLDRLTWWTQDLVMNPARRSVYLLQDTVALCSLTPAPLDGGARWTVTHAIGRTTYVGKTASLETRLDVVVHPGMQAESWFVQVRFLQDAPETVRLCSFQDVMLGTWGEAHREFHRLFVDVTLEDEGVLAFTKRLDTRPGVTEVWNTPFPGAMACACHPAPAGFHTDRREFYGYGGSMAAPAALAVAPACGQLGCWGDPMAGLDVVVPVTGGVAEAVFVTAFGADPQAAAAVARAALQVSRADALAEARRFWEGHLGELAIATPSEDLDVSSLWLRYQAIAARMMARCGLYQASGALGFRDQLQDSMLLLPIAPEKTREQIELHLRHQYQDGSALHWWHPETETGSHTDCSDDYLWSIMAAAEYYRETGAIGFLERRVPWLDGGDVSAWDHLRRSVDRAWERRSPRGIPLLGHCDWNDGLSSAGDKGRGESFWVGHFLHGLLHDMAEMARARGEDDAEFVERARVMRDLVNDHGWDGAWYRQGTTDEGDLIGSSTCDQGRIHLNPQLWSIMAGTATGPYAPRARQAMDAVIAHLKVDWGTLLLAPAYTTPDERIGYLTRYAPGRRENGGVYTHAAVWAGRAARMLGDAALVREFLMCLLPPVRGRDPRYHAEPYVTPGNMDGPLTPTPGRGGWTWYTGSAAWLMRCLLEDLLGVRARVEGLVVDPCVPADWERFSVTRPFRGKLLRMTMRPGGNAGYTVRSGDGATVCEGAGTVVPAADLASFAARELQVDVTYTAR